MSTGTMWWSRSGVEDILDLKGGIQPCHESFWTRRETCLTEKKVIASMGPILGPFSLDRMVRAVEKVRERLLRATSALEKADVLYAVAGGNAVAVWVTRVDESAVRNTRDVDILIRRGDLESVKSALERAGFVYKHSAGIDLFLDGPTAKPRDAVHVIFAGETIRPGELFRTRM